jgi:hypothetical protein
MGRKRQLEYEIEGVVLRYRRDPRGTVGGLDLPLSRTDVPELCRCFAYGVGQHVHAGIESC